MISNKLEELERHHIEVDHENHHGAKNQYQLDIILHNSQQKVSKLNKALGVSSILQRPWLYTSKSNRAGKEQETMNRE